MTIDIVAMLFDFVFEDEHIPASVKALLGRLQIPTLKVAMLDKSFFSSKQHPARRLIDRLAEVVDRPGRRRRRGEATLALIEGVVDDVLHEVRHRSRPVRDAGRTRRRVPRGAEAAPRPRSCERSARLIEAREREEIARVVREEEVARRLAARVWVPVPVRDMLLATWVRALGSRAARSRARARPPGRSWCRPWTTCSGAWSPRLQPTTASASSRCCPACSSASSTDCCAPARPDERRDVFLGSLVDCHAAAVKAGLRGLAALPEHPRCPSRTSRRALRSSARWCPRATSRWRRSASNTARGGVVRNVFTRTGVWTNLQRGTWVEFARGDAAPSRARLTWISPQQGRLPLHQSALGANAISISPEALAEQMRRGEARVLDDAPLVDRAVDSMLENLREQASGIEQQQLVAGRLDARRLEAHLDATISDAGRRSRRRPERRARGSRSGAARAAAPPAR